MLHCLQVKFNVSIGTHEPVPVSGLHLEVPDALLLYCDFETVAIGVNVTLLPSKYDFSLQPVIPTVSHNSG